MTPDIRSAGTISKRNSLIEQPDQTRLDSLCGIIGQLLILVDSVFPLLSHLLLALEMRSWKELFQKSNTDGCSIHLEPFQIDKK